MPRVTGEQLANPHRDEGADILSNLLDIVAFRDIEQDTTKTMQERNDAARSRCASQEAIRSMGPSALEHLYDRGHFSEYLEFAEVKWADEVPPETKKRGDFASVHWIATNRRAEMIEELEKLIGHGLPAVLVSPVRQSR